MTFEFGKDLHELREKVSEWELLIVEYDSRHEVETLADDVKKAILIGGMQEPLKTQLEMQEEGVSYEQLRDQVENFVRARLPWTQEGRREDEPSVKKNGDAMDIDTPLVAAMKGKFGGKGKGKGKGKYAGKGKSGKSAGKVKQQPLAFPGMCHKCGEFGHRAWECPHWTDEDWTCWLCGGYGHRSYECGNANYVDDGNAAMYLGPSTNQDQQDDYVPAPGLARPVSTGKQELMGLQVQDDEVQDEELRQCGLENFDYDVDTASEKSLFRKVAAHM